MVQKNIQTSAPKKKTVPKKLVKGGRFKGKNFPKIGGFKMKIFCTIYPRLPSAGRHRKLCVGICFLWVDVCWLKLQKKIESHPRWEAGMKWFGMWMFSGVLSLRSIRLTAVAFRKPPLWTRFLGLKVSYAIVFTRYLHEWFQSPWLFLPFWVP